jgi:signal transduction histidine kinase
MRRFRVLFLVCALALLGPMALLIHRALGSVALERQMRHQAVAERVFDEMERALSELLAREEERPFDQYGVDVPTPAPPFVIGHFQIDPDGSIHTTEPAAAGAQRATTAEIERTIAAFWRAGSAAAGPRPAGESQLPGTTIEVGVPPVPTAAEARERSAAKREDSAFDALRSLNKGALQRADRQRKAQAYADEEEVEPQAPSARINGPAAPLSREEMFDTGRSEIEFPPMIGRVIDARHLVLYRTVVRETRGYRQGLLLDVDQLGIWLRQQGLGTDGLGAFASVSFATRFAPATVPVADSPFVYRHRFAEPFDGLTARLALRPLPGVGSVTYVYALSLLLLATLGLGLTALYRMVSVVVSFAERRSNFVAAVSHELKTPLTAIRMYGEMLRDGMVSGEAKRHEYYRHITVESERLSRLINNVLEFSRLEKGARSVALVEGSVASVVREAAELLGPHVEGEGFALRLEVDADLPPVRFDRDALLQVLCNLVDNAVKYAREACPKQIVLRCRRHGDGVSLTVRDHGPGVPARHLGRIFEPFYRGESELTRRSKGTGLGLALVRGLVQRMGARVSGRNVPDGGFEVEIAFRGASA